MIRFEDIESKINPDLQNKLHRAQDALAEKQEQAATLSERIKSLDSALETDRQGLADAEQALAKAHQGHNGNGDAMQSAMAAARKQKDESTAKVQKGEESINDLGQGLEYTKREIAELTKVRDKCRLHVIRGLKLAAEPPERPGDKARLLELDTIPVADMVSAFFLVQEFAGGGSNPFAGDVLCPQRFFAFAAKYFGVPNIDDLAVMRTRFDALIWGDYDVPLKGGRGRVGPDAHSPVDWELAGSGVSYDT